MNEHWDDCPFVINSGVSAGSTPDVESPGSTE
jgi:hypothetical protein